MELALESERRVPSSQLLTEQMVCEATGFYLSKRIRTDCFMITDALLFQQNPERMDRDANSIADWRRGEVEQ